jgi:sulfur relay (sulfurtransferase) DsrF/TusC family protein
MARNVAVIIRYSPFNTIKSVEAFRLSVGLTLEGNRVDLLLMEEGVWNALPLKAKALERPDAEQFIQAMELCGVTGHVDYQAIPPTLRNEIRREFQKKSREEMIDLIRKSDLVIPF